MNTTPYSEGSPDAPICFVAEAPGRTEMYAGRPLVGPAGKIFDDILHRAGLIRAEVCIANVCREQIKSGEALIRKDGHLTEEGESHANDLANRLGGHKHNIYVPLGNLALSALTGFSSITKHRGSIYSSPLLDNAKTMGTFHPASLLPGRGPYINKFTIIHDFRRVKDESHFADIRRTNKQLLINPSFSEVEDFMSGELRGGDSVAFDIEIYNYQVSCISFAANNTTSMSIPFVGDYWSEPEEVEVWRWIADFLGDPEIDKIGQNVMFDISFLYNVNSIITRGRIDDTMVLQRVLHPDFPATLEFITSLYTDEPYYKDDKKLWARPLDDANTFYRYNAKDSLVTKISFGPLVEELDKRDPCWRWTYENTMSMLQPCLFLMSRGVKLDLERLKTVKEEVAYELKWKEEELDEVAEEPFNPGSPKQCIAYFYSVKELRPYTNRKTGRPTCDDKALSRIVRKYNLPEARLVQEIRALRKLRDTYLDLSYDKDGRLRCFYDVRGTRFGRLSSKKTVQGTGLNMQNLHPKFKSLIIPE